MNRPNEQTEPSAALKPDDAGSVPRVMTDARTMEALPEPYHSRAKTRLREYLVAKYNLGEGEPVTAEAVNSLVSGGLYYAFVWDETPEGLNFWRQVDDALHKGKGTPLPPFPSSEGTSRVMRVEQSTGIAQALPEQYRERVELRVREYVRTLHTDTEKIEAEVRERLNSSLWQAFPWGSTPEGFRFWRKVDAAVKLRAGAELPPLPPLMIHARNQAGEVVATAVYDDPVRKDEPEPPPFAVGDLVTFRLKTRAGTARVTAVDGNGVTLDRMLGGWNRWETHLLRKAGEAESPEKKQEAALKDKITAEVRGALKEDRKTIGPSLGQEKVKLPRLNKGDLVMVERFTPESGEGIPFIMEMEKMVGQIETVTAVYANGACRVNNCIWPRRALKKVIAEVIPNEEPRGEEKETPSLEEKLQWSVNTIPAPRARLKTVGKKEEKAQPWGIVKRYRAGDKTVRIATRNGQLDYPLDGIELHPEDDREATERIRARKQRGQEIEEKRKEKEPVLQTLQKEEPPHDPSAKDKPRLVILYSGGFDSLAMLRVAKGKQEEHGTWSEIVCLTVGMEHGYAAAESAAIRRQHAAGEFKGVRHVNLGLPLHVLHGKELPQGGQGSQIIPMRNLMLASVASMLGGEIWLGALKGEQLGKERDKSEEFRRRLNHVLGYTGEGIGHKAELMFPFQNYTKTMLMERVVTRLGCGALADMLERTSSCYLPDEEGMACGTCLACVKRTMAVVGATGFSVPNLSWQAVRTTMHAPYAQELRKAIGLATGDNYDKERFTEDRVLEFRRVEALIVAAGIWNAVQGMPRSKDNP